VEGHCRCRGYGRRVGVTERALSVAGTGCPPEAGCPPTELIEQITVPLQPTRSKQNERIKSCVARISSKI
jgi:hypothetical protein